MRTLLLKTGALLLIANSVISWLNVRELRSDQSWTNHTQEVRGALQSVLIDCVDGETGVRGYLLTGTTDFLEPYHRGVKQVGPALDRVEFLTRDNTVQITHAPILKSRVRKKLQLMEQSISTKQTGGELRDLLGEGKQAMDDVRLSITSMTAEEDRLLVKRVQVLDIAYMWLIINSLIFNVLSVILMVALFREWRRPCRI